MSRPPIKPVKRPVEALPPEESVVAESAAVVLGEHRIRWVDQRLRAILLVLVIVLAGFGYFLKHNADVQVGKLRHNLEQSTVLARKNCQSLNATIGKVDDYLQAQRDLTAKRTDIDPVTKAQLLTNFDAFKIGPQDCP